MLAVNGTRPGFNWVFSPPLAATGLLFRLRKTLPKQSFRAALEAVCKHPLVVSIPIALENLCRVVPLLRPQELDHARMAGLDLAQARPAMISKEIAAAEFDRAVDQPAEIIGRLGDTIRRVIDVQVHDRADPGLARPSEKALVVAFDQADGAVDQSDIVLSEVGAHRRQEDRKSVV